MKTPRVLLHSRYRAILSAMREEELEAAAFALNEKNGEACEHHGNRAVAIGRALTAIENAERGQ